MKKILLKTFIKNVRTLFEVKYKQPHWLVAYIDDKNNINIMPDGMDGLSLSEINEFFDDLKVILKRSRKGNDHELH